MSQRGSAAWLILIAALAVPGFMFYHWWSNLNAASKKQLTQKVRKRMPEGTVFTSPPAGQEKLSNPIAALAPAAASTEPVTAVAGSTEAAVAAALAAAAPADASVAAASAATMPPADPAAAPPPGAILIARDPTISPFDVVRLREAEYKARIEAEIRERALRKLREPQPVKREPVKELVLELQGIISTDNGKKAIVNGEIVGEGDLVGEAKVVQITGAKVIFFHRGRRFARTISK